MLLFFSGNILIGGIRGGSCLFIVIFFLMLFEFFLIEWDGILLVIELIELFVIFFGVIFIFF